MDDSRFKFRAWDEVNKVMLYSCKDYTVWVGGVESRVTADTWGRNISYEFVMQYTGLKDKNGKEIYEGDIITNEIYDQGTKRFNPKTGFYDYDKKKEIVVVRYNEYWGHFIFSNQSIRGKIEIIGNIYENPELLEAK